MAFRIAGRQAVREALAAAGPVLLQPVFRLRIHAPSFFTGAFGPIVAALHGQVLGFAPDESARGWDVFEALAPAAALPGLANDVRAATQGVGYFEAAFDHYEEVHGKEANRIVEDHAREAVAH
jgi:elongation factor G